MRTSFEVLNFVDHLITTKLERKRRARRERQRQPKDRETASVEGKTVRATQIKKHRVTDRSRSLAVCS